MQLSEHFGLDEFTRSATAMRLRIDNTPKPDAMANLRALCRELEKVRAITGKPLRILSGYRAPKVNAAVGGAKHSYHMDGLAADFDPPSGWTHALLRDAIREHPDIDFDLLLEEEARDGAHWLHFQVPRPGTKARRLVRYARLERQGGAITRMSAA